MDFQNYYEIIIEVLVDNFDLDDGEYYGEVILTDELYQTSCDIAKKFDVGFNDEHTALAVLEMSKQAGLEPNTFSVSSAAVGCVVDYLEDNFVVEFDDEDFDEE